MQQKQQGLLTWTVVEALCILHEEVDEQEHQQERADGQISCSHQTQTAL
jgi:hypothetical protein